MKRPIVIVAAAVLCACHHQARPPASAKASEAAPRSAEEAALGAQPQLPPLRRFDAPVPRIERLKNGLPVYLVERKGDGLESLLLVVRGGASADPEGQAGLASLAAALMETGAAGRSQTELAAAADAIGASLSVAALQDALVVSGSALATNLGPMVGLVSDVALRPNLAQAEWTHVQQQRQAALVAERAEPGVAATYAFRAAAYGQNALARPLLGTLASVKAIRLAGVKRFYASLDPGEAALVAVGGAPADAVLRALGEAFGSWKPHPARLAPPPQAPVPAERPRFTLVDFPGRPQTVLVVGQPSAPRSSPDYLALEAMSSVLGGSFTSRLNQNLREQHGYTYGAASRFTFGKGPGPFAARTSVKTDVTGPALGEMLKEIEGTVAQPVAPAELDKARALLAYDLVERLSGADALSRAVAEIFLYGLPPDELQTYVPRLQALTPESVQAAAARAVDPAHLTIAIAGDAAKVLPQLAPLHLPPPQLRGPSGELR
jgi:predicted Zn-dependent peptidase